MARIRTIKPEFCTSRTTAKLSRDARLFFVLTLTEADDKGRLIDSPKRLAGILYPHDDDVTAKLVEKWKKECIAVDMLRTYVVDGVPYLAVVNFSVHQRVNRPTPSRLPEPPWESLTTSSLSNSVSDSRIPQGPELGTGELGNRSLNPISTGELSQADREQLLSEGISEGLIDEALDVARNDAYVSNVLAFIRNHAAANGGPSLRVVIGGES